MSKFVQTCWGTKEINEQPYWHLIDPASFFYNNVRVAKGALLSVSAGIEAEPGIENAQTLYSLSRIIDGKEKIFEQVRLASFAACPPRLKSIYVFDDYSLVERAQKEWFTDNAKVIHECRIIVGAILHKADTAWLNSLPEQWGICAQKYWAGEMSQNPFPEVLVHGALYFPGRENFPSA